MHICFPECEYTGRVTEEAITELGFRDCPENSQLQVGEMVQEKNVRATELEGKLCVL